jgi:hypothetical protein
MLLFGSEGYKINAYEKNIPIAAFLKKPLTRKHVANTMFSPSPARRRG